MLKTFVGNAASEFDVDSIDEAAWARLAERMTYISGDFTKPEIYGSIRDALGKAEKEHGTKGNAIFYLAVADRFFGTVVDQLGKAKLTQQGGGDVGKPSFWRRVVIEKPFGHSVAVGARAQCRHPAHLVGGPDLPHRSLPRQGHGSEHHGVPLRQRPVRADLESRPHRSRADHRFRDGRRGAARRFLRGDRRAARHGSQSRLHLAVDGGHGAAQLLRCRSDPDEEGRCVRRDAVGQAGQGGARPVWPRRRAGLSGEGLSERAEGRCGFEYRDLCRDGTGDRQLALGRRAVLHPHRQAHGRAA